MPEKTHPKPKPEPNAARTALIARIGQEGQISVAEYMAVAAAHYYAGRDPFGVKGDFTTAPEISQMYGEMLGAWLIDAWMQLGKPEAAQLIELGPGRGTLAADIMRTISTWPDCKAALSLHLVETSPLLRQQQSDVLKDFNPTWHEKVEDVPDGIGFIIANEFFDALPIRQFEKIKGKWHERFVGYEAEKDKFFFIAEPCNGADLPDAPDGSVFETSPASFAVLEEMSRRIEKHGGAALIVDYGHIHAGFGDTLQTLRRHKFSPVLDSPGGDDITAHVDFNAFRIAAESRLQIHGPVEQGAFLTGLGIMQRAEAMRAKANDKQRKDIDLALHRLVVPTEMGQLFKVLGLTQKGSTIRPAGFGEDVT